jgi:hypothetical protein
MFSPLGGCGGRFVDGFAASVGAFLSSSRVKESWEAKVLVLEREAMPKKEKKKKKLGVQSKQGGHDSNKNFLKKIQEQPRDERGKKMWSCDVAAYAIIMGRECRNK